MMENSGRRDEVVDGKKTTKERLCGEDDKVHTMK